MKKLIMIIALFAISRQAHALSLQQLAGTYKVTTDMAPISNLVSLTSDGAVTLIETSPDGRIQCEGQAHLGADRVLTSEVTCTNGLVFVQKINLSKVKALKSFKAPVYSSLYDAELEMDFVKVK
ncbi:MAG: hypothetical protein OM95_10390 [Bdellovibrio sp. ArHS]|uniref:hypothetical protein n=1 Tax=Bdellovibrio sp. ArHS TaxID=1569284 RepID=UPI0005828D54|nr:hypothetical protein [Bdellovibrio sp. ArHS]KHD88169.1 MAG: hypothetical protein OM95_10390 [Bdellovibrio sp. ArHS]